ncbi:MAG: rod shape-determining protein [Lachnospiraceae bacterium]|nr:rod shape-determining protein [Lachnospiraceae bacterium]
MASNKYGLDLGSDTVKVFSEPQNKYYKVRNLIAVKKKNIISYGDDAYSLYGRTPDDIELRCPVKKGVIADLDIMGMMFSHVLKQADCNRKFMRRNEFYVAVPSAVTEVEKKAFYDLTADSGFNSKRSRIVERPMAEAAGIGMDIKNTQGSMIIDIGAETTEVSVISMGGIMISRLIPIGGNDITRLIIETVRNTMHIELGMKTVEELKINMSLDEGTEEHIEDVYGNDLVKGLPVKTGIRKSFVRTQVLAVTKKMISGITGILQSIPPELYGAIKQEGVHLAGGCSLNGDIVRQIALGTGMKVHTYEEPELISLKGLNTIMNDRELLSMAFTIDESEFD